MRRIAPESGIRGRRAGAVPVPTRWTAALTLVAGVAILLTSAPASSDFSPTLQDVVKTFNAGRYADAETQARALLAETEQNQGADSPETALVLDRLVRTLIWLVKSKNDETRQLADRAIAIKEARFGPDDPRLVPSLANLGLILTRRTQYDEARKVLDRAVSLHGEGSSLLEQADALHALGNLLRDMGSYAEAKDAYARALELRRKAPPGEEPDEGFEMSAMGNVLTLMGEYREAQDVLEDAVVLLQKTYGAQHPYVADALNYLGNALMETRDYDAARPRLEQALEIRKATLGPEHANIGHSLNNLGVLQLYLDDFDGAIALFQQALVIREKANGTENPLTALTLNNLGIAQQDSGDLDAAGKSLQRALEIYEKAEGPDHLDVARAARNLASVLKDSGDYEGAEALIRRALKIRRRSLGEDHPYVSADLKHLAEILVLEGKPEEALKEALEAEEIIRHSIRITSRGLAERQALRYAASHATGLDVALSLAARGLPTPQLREIWDSVIRSRAQVFDEMAARHRKVAETSDPEVARLAERLSTARVHLANLVVGGPGSEGASEHVRILEQAREEAERDERELAAKSTAFRTAQEQGAAGLEEVETSLPPGTALVAYARYAPISTAHAKIPTERTSGKPGKRMPREQTAAYAAWILRSGDPAPAFVPLGPAPAIEKRVEAWRKEAAEDPPPAPEAGRLAERRYRETAVRLRQAVWDPVAGKLAGASQVFVVPDDVLNLISLATLPEGKDRYLLETGPEIHYLSAERDLVRAWKPPQKGSGLLVLGDPDFDKPARPLSEDPTIAKTAVSPLAQETTASRAVESGSPAGSWVYRGETAECDRFRSTHWEPLPASRREAEQVARLWRRAKAKGPEGTAVLQLTGSQAAEATVKLHASEAQVLHLATHAFVLQDRCPSALGAGGARSGEGFAAGLALPPLVGDNPLLLSGLVLAGANRKSPAAETSDGEDGVLTAEEIGSLDLSGVQWVVLSACETGVGKVQAGEGILGLRRSFEIAGAGSLIMTLWRVKDDPAREWINELYKARLAGASTSLSVRKASLAALAARRRAGRPTHPFSWGAFVAAGDWR